MYEMIDGRSRVEVGSTTTYQYSAEITLRETHPISLSGSGVRSSIS